MELDLFKQRIPQINLKGREEAASWFGTFISLIILGLMSIYIPLKFDMLMTRHNPSISKTEDLGALGEDDVLDLGQAGLKFAFNAENFQREPINDPRYVKFVVTAFHQKDGILETKPILFHKCSEAELRQLPPPTKDAEIVIEELIASETRFMYCFDWTEEREDLSIWGDW